MVIELSSSGVVEQHANLWNSPSNQLRRALGRYTTVYCGGVDGGTVRDESGKCWDWWPTDEVLPAEGSRLAFSKVRIVEAR